MVVQQTTIASQQMQCCWNYEIVKQKKSCEKKKTREKMYEKQQ